MSPFVDYVSIPASSSKTTRASTSSRRASKIETDDASTTLASSSTGKHTTGISKSVSSVNGELGDSPLSFRITNSPVHRVPKQSAEGKRKRTSEMSSERTKSKGGRPHVARMSVISPNKGKKRDRPDSSGQFSDGVHPLYETPSAKRRRVSVKNSRRSYVSHESSEEPEGELIVALTGHLSDDSDDPMLLRDPKPQRKRTKPVTEIVPDSEAGSPHADSSFSPVAPSPFRDEPPIAPNSPPIVVKTDHENVFSNGVVASMPSPSASITATSPPDHALPIPSPVIVDPPREPDPPPKDPQPRADTPAPADGVLIDVPLANALQLLASEIKDMRREVREYADAQVEAVRREFQAYKDIMSKQLLHAEDRAQRSESMVRNYISWGVNPAYFYSGPPAPGATAASAPSHSGQTSAPVGGVADTVPMQQDTVGTLDTHALASSYPQPDGTVDSRSDTIGDAASAAKLLDAYAGGGSDRVVPSDTVHLDGLHSSGSGEVDIAQSLS